jgi:hypothetical protein
MSKEEKAEKNKRELEELDKMLADMKGYFIVLSE